MGSIFSGNYHRRSAVPFLDGLPCISVVDVTRTISATGNCYWVYLPIGTTLHQVRVVTIRAGVMDQRRFCCPSCARRCSILYLDEELKCNRCSGRYRVQSESRGRRTERRAHKILRNINFDDNRCGRRVAGRKMSVHLRLKQLTRWAAEVVFGRHERVTELLRRSDRLRAIK